MSEQTQHGKKESKDEHKASSISDLVNMMEPFAMPTLSAGAGAGAAYLAFGSTIVYAPITIGGLLGLGVYYGYKKLFGSDKKDEHADEANTKPHEPALAGAHGGSH